MTRTRGGNRRYDDIPVIDDSAEFGIAVVKWWYEMQPAFRRGADNALVAVYEVDDASVWDPLRKSGPNGLVLLMTVLAWWGRAIFDRTQYQVDSSVEWRKTVLDVKTCISSILATTDASRKAKKRKREDQKEKKSKRYVFFCTLNGDYCLFFSSFPAGKCSCLIRSHLLYLFTITISSHLVCNFMYVYVLKYFGLTFVVLIIYV